MIDYFLSFTINVLLWSDPIKNNFIFSNYFFFQASKDENIGQPFLGAKANHICPHCREGKSEAKKQTQTAKEEHRQLVNEEDQSCGGGSLNRLQTRKNWHPTQRKKYNIVMGKKKKRTTRK